MNPTTTIETPNAQTKKTWEQLQQRMKEADISRLSESLNPQNGLFDKQIRARKWQGVQGREVLTSTAINLIGIHRAQIGKEELHLDEQKSFAMLTDAFRKTPYIGGIGLVLWANAVWSALDWDIVESRCNTQELLRQDTVRKFTTMELAWLIAGLLHMQKQAAPTWANDVLQHSVQILESRYCEQSGLFLHADDRSPVRQRSRKGISNFADQIYSVFSLSVASIFQSNPRWLFLANACAKRLVETQGELGQWWWHYHSRSGKVAQSFPVYSVHQRSMAPMALLALRTAGGDHFEESLQKGARWLERNELGINLIDDDVGTVWRDIEHEEWLPLRWVRQAKVVVSQPLQAPIVFPFRARQRLKTNYETRPYEWGWSLYASALAQNNKVHPHIV